MPFTEEDERFRDEVRSFLKERLPKDISQKVLAGMEVGKDDYMRWHKILFEKGWVAPNWPTEHGGAAWNVRQKYIWDEETGAAGAPRLSPFGLTMAGPVLMAFGNEEQKKHLPKIVNGEELWCQGYSEPGSGSDLASLKTRADRKDDHYLVNGQKLWTSLAHHADWIFCLVRTSQEAKKQDGISFIIFPMTLPGIEIRPLITINDLRHVNEVFFHDVKVPLDGLVGEEGKGWTIAKYLLEHERTHTGSVGELKTQLQRVKDIAGQETDGFGSRPPGRRRLPPPPGPGRGRSDLDRADESSRAGRLLGRPQGGDGLVGSQDPSDGAAAADHRTRRSGGRLLRHAVQPRRAERRLERGADRRRLFQRPDPELLFLPRRLDLQRLERDPAQHHRQAGTAAVTPAHAGARAWAQQTQPLTPDRETTTAVTDRRRIGKPYSAAAS